MIPFPIVYKTYFGAALACTVFQPCSAIGEYARASGTELSVNDNRMMTDDRAARVSNSNDIPASRYPRARALKAQTIIPITRIERALYAREIGAGSGPARNRSAALNTPAHCVNRFSEARFCERH